MSKYLTLAIAAAVGVAFALPASAAENMQQSKMATCQKEAGAKKLEGKERQSFVNECLKAKPMHADKMKGKSKMAECNAKTKGMEKEEADKVRSECMKAA
jgi:hypothetical protein